MFGLSQFMRTKNSVANDHGFDAAMLGLTKENPYPPNTIDYKQWEWGYQEGIDTLEETVSVHHISNEYKSDW